MLWPRIGEEGLRRNDEGDNADDGGGIDQNKWRRDGVDGEEMRLQQRRKKMMLVIWRLREKWSSQGRAAAIECFLEKNEIHHFRFRVDE